MLLSLAGRHGEGVWHERDQIEKLCPALGDGCQLAERDRRSSPLHIESMRLKNQSSGGKVELAANGLDTSLEICHSALQDGFVWIKRCVQSGEEWRSREKSGCSAVQWE
jgi:hypothetical protein